MTNRVTLIGKILDIPKVRSFETNGGSIEVVSLWMEVQSGERADRFTIEINCPKSQLAAKALKPGVLAEVSGALRHDRWKDKQSGKWTGKVFVAIDPGEGKVKSQGLA